MEFRKRFFKFSSNGITPQQQKIILFSIFSIFLFLRLFSASPYFFIQGSDDARYLALAKHFPLHTLDNKQFYVTHPPLFPWMVHIFSLPFPEHYDYLAGIFLSLLSASITFFLLYGFFMLLTSNFLLSITPSFLFSVSPFFIALSTSVSKESFATMLTFAFLYYFLSYLKKPKRSLLVFSCVLGILNGFTTDHTLLLIPSAAMMLIFFKNKATLKSTCLPLFFVILGYALWIGVRAYIYSHYEYYPASFDGTLVHTGGWGFKELLSPHYFIDSYIEFGTVLEFTHYLYPFLYMFNVVFFPWPTGLTFATLAPLFTFESLPQLLGYSSLLAFLIYGLIFTAKKLLKSPMANKHLAYILLLFIIYFAPASQIVTSTRYISMANFFIYAFVGYGASLFFANRFQKFLVPAIMLLVGTMLLLLPSYYFDNPHFIFTKEKIVELRKTAPILEQLPGDGIMAQFGYTHELNYLTDKRVMALPASVNELFLMDTFNITYVLYGEYYMEPFSEDARSSTFNYDIIKHIRSHPEKFKLLMVIEEQYPSAEKSDHISIYRVVPSKGSRQST